MATVNAMTAAAMQAIANGVIVSASIVGNNLIFTKQDGSTLNVGSIVGLGVSGLLEWPNTNLGEIATGPEGVTTAKPGSMRFKTNGEVWIKLTGTGNTGWAKVPTVAPTNMLHIVCTDTTRPSSPSVGQPIYETNTGKHLMYYGATTGWKPFWYEDWGPPVHATTTGSLITSGTTPTIISGGPTFTPEAANRKIEIVVTGSRVSANDGIFTSEIRNGGTGGSVYGNQRTTVTTQQEDFVIIHTVDLASTASITPVWVLSRIAGAAGTMGAIAAVPIAWRVRDIGPATGSTPPAA